MPAPQRIAWRLLSAVTLFSMASVAHADDAGLAFGGTPRMLNQHRSVCMTDEVVRITVTRAKFRMTGLYWHTKTVRFRAYGICHVRDVYTQRIGGGDPREPHVRYPHWIGEALPQQSAGSGREEPWLSRSSTERWCPGRYHRVLW
jgi:hypothetical protein